VDFLATLAAAEARTDARDWQGAAQLWELVVAANPVEGRFFSQLAQAREEVRQYQGAIDAYTAALDLRDGYPAETAYRIGCCHARLDDPDRALTWLQQALDMGFRYPDQAADEEALAPLRDDGRFRALLGAPDVAVMSRDEGLRSDLQVLVREVKRRAYAPFREVSEETFDAAARELHDAIPDVTDGRVLAGMRKLVRLLGDAHAYVHPSFDDTDLFRPLPIQLFEFEEGMFVVAADPAHEDMLGSKVLAIGERTLGEAVAAVEPLVALDNGNRRWLRNMTAARLTDAAMLEALDIVPRADAVGLTVRCQDGATRAVQLSPVPAEPNPARRRRLPCPDGWRFLPDTLTAPPPLYLRNPDANYWFTDLREERTVYCQFNRVADGPREPLAEFSRRLLEHVADHDVDRLVIDVRANGGGNTFLEMPLLHSLIGSRKVNRRGRLFVIIGRATFSAAQNFATLLQRHTEAIFVGEPTGSSPTFVGESVEFRLPYSGLRANVSDLLWQSSWPMDYRTWIAPTLYAPPTFEAFAANRDPAMNAILACRDHLPGW
jgi:tetratricopeptide (TPR) repeat protein